jgi:hypothetical protein
VTVRTFHAPRETPAFRQLGRVLDDAALDLTRIQAVVAGGSVANALRSRPLGRDVDLFCLTDAAFEEAERCCRKAGLGIVHTHGVSTAKVFGRSQVFPQIDLVPPRAATVEEILLGFDIRAMAVATDICTLWAVPGALQDLFAERIALQRQTTPSRVQRMLRRGWSFVGATGEMLGRLQAGVPVPGLTSDSLTFAQRFGAEPVPALAHHELDAGQPQPV